MVGTIYAPVMSFISSDLLSVQETISLIGVVILGGAGTLAGPIVGTFVFLGIPSSCGSKVCTASSCSAW